MRGDEEPPACAAEVCADEIEIEALEHHQHSAVHKSSRSVGDATRLRCRYLGRSARGSRGKSGREPQSTQDRGCSGCVISCRILACLGISWFLSSGRSADAAICSGGRMCGRARQDREQNRSGRIRYCERCTNCAHTEGSSERSSQESGAGALGTRSRTSPLLPFLHAGLSLCGPRLRP